MRKKQIFLRLEQKCDTQQTSATKWQNIRKLNEKKKNGCDLEQRKIFEIFCSQKNMIFEERRI